jgi:K+ transporter
MGEMRNVYKIFVGKSEKWHRWEDNIKMYLKKTGLQVVDWIHLAQDRVLWQVLVNLVVILQAS